MRIFAYNLIFLILLPFTVARIIIKSFLDKGYLTNFHHRFGIYKKISSQKHIWFHAVSLGEVISSETIIRRLLNDTNLVLTTSTPTGYREAKKIYGNDVKIVYAPWDFIFFVKGFIKNFNPIALILFETEVWPSMIYLSEKRKIPIILSNARLSESSYKKYLLLSFFTKYIFKKLSLVLAQSNRHVKNFKNIGIQESKIKEVGSVKFDTNKIKTTESNLKEYAGNLILATSTHVGEDEIIIDAFCKLRIEFPDLKLIIVPRHPERSDSVLKILENRNINSNISSRIPNEMNSLSAVVINTTGLLNSLYKLANVAFIGGSLLNKYGGHNIIEPASNKCAFIVGPYMRNFKDILGLFKDQHACMEINNSDELFNAYKELLNNNELRVNMIDNASMVVSNNSGSSEKQYKYIIEIIKNETSNSNN
jgi:3-deoxy-D-manno-octulosonic-acid transferase